MLKSSQATLLLRVVRRCRKKADKVHVLQGNELLSLRDRMSKENLSFAHEKSSAAAVY